MLLGNFTPKNKQEQVNSGYLENLGKYIFFRQLETAGFRGEPS